MGRIKEFSDEISNLVESVRDSVEQWWWRP